MRAEDAGDTERRRITDRRTFFYRVSELLALLCWSLLYLLRNRWQSWLSREEIRLARFSFSQFGEDLVIEELTNQPGIERGFYVDVGAFDPVTGSNTLLLFKRGWSGINIQRVCDEASLGIYKHLCSTNRSRSTGVGRMTKRICFVLVPGPQAVVICRLVDRGRGHEVSIASGF
jgi:hypothetical protein